MIYSLIKKAYHNFMKKKRKQYLNNLIKNGLCLGENVEIIDTFFFDPSHCFLIKIGNNCTICPNVRLIAHDASIKKQLGYTKIGKINIGENCFIGDSVIVLSCVNIGSGSIIGAGSIVTKDIPPGMVAAGNPARVICSVDEYLARIKILASKKKIFNENYFIENLNKAKREEILQSVDKTLGFIV
ncbi:MAG: acyltransferase [Deltaproteobacteria bacterium]|uniref:acyltransferase n=1 Tax=Desulfobacula sp. TaxID=2593537 RepID=UPI0019A02369|nr:acyltransferase [Candidatus Desulfobacula maris]MBL6992778.1 acyltransferase [Desulfobacula sp.]